MLEYIWSGSDFPYMCLKDEDRTIAFKKAIQTVVKPGDVVVDVGSGSGILAFFAAGAGAEKVYAVEVDHELAEALRHSVRANDLEGVVEVVEADIMEADLPQDVDVVVAEIIETGLLDELQVPAINRLYRDGIIGKQTKVIPESYTTFAELAYSDNSFYGYRILAPKHEWPFYTQKNAGWAQSNLEVVSSKAKVAEFNFQGGIMEQSLRAKIELELSAPDANLLKLTGLIRLTGDQTLGATNALNGDKYISIEPIRGEKRVSLELSFRVGGGMQSLKIKHTEHDNH